MDKYFPLPHGVQVGELARAYHPGEHGVHAIEPAMEEVPGPHGLHDANDDDAESVDHVPAGHLVHCAWPDKAANVPGRQSSHETVPLSGAAVPTPHGVQLDLPANPLVSVPAGHRVHANWPT